MTISIHIEAHPDRGDMKKQIDDAMAALGFDRRDAVWRKVAQAEYQVSVQTAASGDEHLTAEEPEQPAPAANDDLDTRPVGSAPEGKSRRTKAEMADDEELTKLAEKAGVDVEKLNAAIAKAGRREASIQLATMIADAQTGADEKPAISTGEERVGPEDAPETEEQDQADEQAEVAETAKADFTADDLRAAMSGYVKKHGMAHAQADGAAIFNDALGSLGDGEFWSISKVAAAGQDKLTKAINAWEKAGAADARYGNG